MNCRVAIRWLIPVVVGVILLFTVYSCSSGLQSGRVPPVSFAEVKIGDRVPTWRGLVPGRTLAADVRKTLGAPRHSRSYDGVELLFYGRESNCEYETDICHRIMLQQGRVQTIVLHLFNNETPHATVADITTAYGAPEVIEENTLLYPHLGMTMVVYENREPLRVTEARHAATHIQNSRQLRQDDIGDDTIIDYVMLYEPVTMSEYHDTWGRFHPLDNPWKRELPQWTDLEIIPGVTTKREVVDLLGEPDLQGFATGFSQSYAMYRVPGRPDDDLVRIFFDLGGTVQIVSGFVSAEPPYRLQDAIARYGIPDLIEAPYPPGDMYPARSATNLIMWQDSGLIYKAVKPPGNTDCSLQSRSVPSGWEPCPGPEDIVIMFYRIVPPTGEKSSVPYLPQFDWRPSRYIPVSIRFNP